MSIIDRLNLIKQVGEEIIEEAELKKLLENGEELIAYDGFEPSGQIHIAQGILRAINVNKMIKAGIRFKMLVSDWTAFCNDKYNGDLEKIRTVGKYFLEVWKVSGMDPKVEFVWASDVVQEKDYWKLVVQVGRTNKLPRFVRTAEFMGREAQGENLSAAQIIYPCIQISDIFTLGAKITQLGMDQRKVNMLAREIGPQLGFWKPVVVSHHMLMSLNPSIGVKGSKADITIAKKMSKSSPDSAIFMTDTTDDIKRKITKAYCPEGEVKENPILEYCKYIIFESFDRLKINHITIERPEKWGGNMELKTYEELEKQFAAKQLHPQDLKNTVVNLLDKLLQPVRKHFEENETAKNLLKQVQGFQVTR